MKSALKLRPKDVIVNRQAREWTAARFRRRAAELAEAERQEDRLRSWFQELDEDGSGEISAKELQDPMLILGLARSATDVFELVERLDTDGSAEISFDEFKGALGESPASSPMARRRLKALIDKLSKGNDAHAGGEKLEFATTLAAYRRKVLMSGLQSNASKHHATATALCDAHLNGDRSSSIARDRLGGNQGHIAPLDAVAARSSRKARKWASVGTIDDYEQLSRPGNSPPGKILGMDCAPLTFEHRSSNSRAAGNLVMLPVETSQAVGAVKARLPQLSGTGLTRPRTSTTKHMASLFRAPKHATGGRWGYAGIESKTKPSSMFPAESSVPPNTAVDAAVHLQRKWLGPGETPKVWSGEDLRVLHSKPRSAAALHHDYVTERMTR